MKNLLIALAVVLLLAGAGVYFFYPSLGKPTEPKTIETFEECQNAGNLVVDTRPRECHTKSSQVFVEEYNGVLLKNSIKITSPEPNSIITSPFKIEGEAIGNWYFNNQLTAKLQDDKGKILVTKQLNALSTTQTDAFVPFVAAMDFQAIEAETPRGRLLIEKTNPSYTSGETGPLVIPVKFEK